MGSRQIKQGSIDEKTIGIVALYTSAKYTTERIAAIYNVTPRKVQRIAKEHGVIRTIAESNRLMAPLKNYRFIPPELRKKRKYISNKQRYLIISKHPYCKVCGDAGAIGIRLEVDHKDGDPTNNNPRNLQVLCQRCNIGKGVAQRSDY